MGSNPLANSSSFEITFRVHFFVTFESHVPVPLIIGDIIDSLTKDNAKDLQYVKACLLVCQSFRPLCRTHIFSSIKIKITGSEPDEELQNTEAFGQLLLKTPEMATIYTSPF